MGETSVKPMMKLFDLTPSHKCLQVVQLSQRDLAAGWISVLAKRERRYSAHNIIGLSLTTVT